MEKSLLNGGVNGKIIYKWAMFHGYVSHNQSVYIRDGSTSPTQKNAINWGLGHFLAEPKGRTSPILPGCIIPMFHGR